MGTQLRPVLTQGQSLFWDRRKGGTPFAVCVSALLVLCRLRATVGIIVQWVPCALREGRVCARADAAENRAAGPDLTYCGGGELTSPSLFVRLEKMQRLLKNLPEPCK